MIRQQLERVLGSQQFARSKRISRFLRFIVEQTLSGRAESLKEQVLACELYGRDADFNAAVDAVVRVDARRVRDKLREYYAENPGEPVLIIIPKGTYVPDSQINPAAAPAISAQPTPPAARTRSPAWKVALAAVAVTGLAMTAWLARPRPQPSLPKLLPLTSTPGNEGQASLSPDGNFVAFACTASHPSAEADICVKAVGTEVVQRLTNTAEPEYWPAWSPDGREIMFGRGRGGAAPAYQEFGRELGIFVVSRMGGPERRISETGTIAGWTPDGKSILIRDRLARDEPYAIFQLDPSSSHRRRITQPLSGTGDWRFDVSPDGETLAFIRVIRPGISDVYVVPMQGGEPRRLTDWNRAFGGIAWTPDGKELIYSLDRRLWRISASLPKPGRGSPIPDIPVSVIGVSLSRPATRGAVRLVFTTSITNTRLHRIDLESAAGGTIRGSFPFTPSTRVDSSPGRFSSDGTKVLFASNRASADIELWVANSDGTDPRQLTFFGATRGVLAGSWSPDGKRLVFDAAIGGNHDIYVMPADGGKPVRMTTDPGVDILGNWSTDGRWIYYTAQASGPDSNIWRIPAQGGPPQQITKKGGFEPQLSRDGYYLYYLDRAPLAGNARLVKMPIGGGDVTVLQEGVSPFLWSVTDKGIYFLREQNQTHSVHLHRFGDGRIVDVGRLPFRAAPVQFPGRFTVSRDGRWGLINVEGPREGDLMLLENFR